MVQWLHLLFQSTRLREARHSLAYKVALVSGFNPRAYVRRDYRLVKQIQVFGVFQSTRLREARPLRNKYGNGA